MRLPPVQKPRDTQVDSPAVSSSKDLKRKITKATPNETDAHVKAALRDSGFYPENSKRPRGRFDV